MNTASRRIPLSWRRSSSQTKEMSGDSHFCIVKIMLPNHQVVSPGQQSLLAQPDRARDELQCHNFPDMHHTRNQQRFQSH